VTRRVAIGGGLALGAAIALLILVLLQCGTRDEGARAPGDTTPEAAEAGPDDAALDATAAGPAVPALERVQDESGARLRTLPVTIYQRAGTRTLRLTGAGARIVWFDAPVERARQLVRLVLDGVAAKGALRAAPEGVDYNDVFIDPSRTAWIDLTAESVPLLSGQDVEETVVACLVKTLVDNLAEVRRVGFLIDGEPRRTLSGHVDLSRTFDGSEWPGG